ncbi:hypothetical protein DUHN55_15940 [Helicobacter pylori]
MPHNRWMPTDRHVSPLRVVVSVAVMVAVMLLVAALGEWVIIPSSALRELDEGSAFRAVALLADHDGLAEAARVWSDLSGPWVVHPIVAIAAGALVLRRRITARAGVVVMAIGLVGWALGAVAKEIVERPRPAQAVLEVGSFSYPSGHATNIALGAVLLIALARAAERVWIRWGTALLALLAVILTAADRILLGVHYVTDVAMGLGFGAAAAILALAALPLRPNSAKP